MPGGLRHRPRGPRGRRRPHASRRLRPVVPAPHPRTRRHGAFEPGAAAAHAATRRCATDGPVAIRYPRGMAAPFAPPDEARSPDRSARVESLEEGRDVALVGIGTGVGIAREAADLLAADGLQPTLVDARFVKPLDTALLDRLAATHDRIVTVEENVLAGGFGSAVAEYLSESRRRGDAVRAARPLRDARRPRLLLGDIGLTPEADRRGSPGAPFGPGARLLRPRGRERLDVLLVERGLLRHPGAGARGRPRRRDPRRRRASSTSRAPRSSLSRDRRRRRAPPLRLARRRQARPRPGRARRSTSPARTSCDLGSSTGGFVDRLLQGGAARVVAVDVGYGQLDWGLRERPPRHRPRAHQRARSDRERLPFAPSFVTADVSFISLTVALGPVLESLRDPATAASCSSSPSSRPVASGSARAAWCATRRSTATCL